MDTTSLCPWAILLLTIAYTGAASLANVGCPEHNFLSCVTRLRLQRVPFDKNMLNVVFNITSEAKLMHTCKAYSDVLPCFRDKIVDCGNNKQKRLLDEVAKMVMFFCSPFSMQRQRDFIEHGQCIGSVLQMPASTSCLIEGHYFNNHIQACREACYSKREFICMMKIWISEQSLCTLIDVQNKCGKPAADFFMDLQTNVFEKGFPIICDLPADFDPNVPRPAPAKPLPPPPTKPPIDELYPFGSGPAEFGNNNINKNIYGPQIQPTKMPIDFDYFIPQTTTTTSAAPRTTATDSTDLYRPYQYVTIKSKPRIIPPEPMNPTEVRTEWFPPPAPVFPKPIYNTPAPYYPEENWQYLTPAPGYPQNYRPFTIAPSRGRNEWSTNELTARNFRNSSVNKIHYYNRGNQTNRNGRTTPRIVTITVAPPVARPYRPFPRNPYFPPNYQSNVVSHYPNNPVWPINTYQPNPSAYRNRYQPPPAATSWSVHQPQVERVPKEYPYFINNFPNNYPTGYPTSNNNANSQSLNKTHANYPETGQQNGHGALFPLSKLRPYGSEAEQQAGAGSMQWPSSGMVEQTGLGYVQQSGSSSVQQGGSSPVQNVSSMTVQQGSSSAVQQAGTSSVPKTGDVPQGRTVTGARSVPQVGSGSVQPARRNYTQYSTLHPHPANRSHANTSNAVNYEEHFSSTPNNLHPFGPFDQTSTVYATQPSTTTMTYARSSGISESSVERTPSNSTIKVISNNSLNPSLSAHPLPLNIVPWYLQSARIGHIRPAKARAPPRSSNVYPTPDFSPENYNNNHQYIDKKFVNTGMNYNPVEPPWYDFPAADDQHYSNLQTNDISNDRPVVIGPEKIRKDYYHMPMPSNKQDKTVLVNRVLLVLLCCSIVLLTLYR